MKRFLSLINFALTFISAVAIVLGSIFWFMGRSNKDQVKPEMRRGAGGPAAVAIEAMPLKIGTLVDEGQFVGTIEPSSRFMVAPKISGRLKQLLVDIGDTVNNGAVIARLDDEELLLAVKQAEADLEIARANVNESSGLLEISQKDLDRVVKMRQQKVSSDVDVENAQATHKTRQSRHQVNKALFSQKEAALGAAKIRQGYATVDSSWSGGANARFVAERFQNEGSMVSANTPIVSVIDIATVTAVIDVVERDYFKIRPGLKAEIEPAALPGCVYQATVSRVAPMLDDASRQARVELELRNVDYALKPGMFIKARIIYDIHSSTVIAPNSAIVRRNNVEGLFLVDKEKNTASFVPVKKGFVEGDQAEIISPKLTGEVVTLGHHLLEDGAAIILPRAESEEDNKDKGKGSKKGGKKP